MRALKRKGYGIELRCTTYSKQGKLKSVNDEAVCRWMENQRPDVVILAAATVGGIEANRRRPAEFLQNRNRNKCNRNGLA